MSYTDFMKDYERNKKMYPVLDFNQQAECVVKAKAGDNHAMDQLIMGNMGLIIDAVRQKTEKFNYRCGSLEFEDLVQEGVLGIMEAIKSYEPDHETKFTSYAVWWINRYIIAAMSQDSSTIRVPTHTLSKAITITRVIDWLKTVLERDPTEEEIIREMGSQFNAESIRDLLQIIQSTHLIELDATVNTDKTNHDATLGDIVPSEDLSPEEIAIKTERHEKLMKAVKELKPREQAVIIFKWGLVDGIERTLEETAQSMYEAGYTNKSGGRISKQAVDQLETRAMKKLEIKVKKAFGVPVDEETAEGGNK